MNLYDIEYYLDPKWKFCVLKIAVDDEDDDPWLFTETEERAKEKVISETEAYNSPNYQFKYVPVTHRERRVVPKKI